MSFKTVFRRGLLVGLVIVKIARAHGGSVKQIQPLDPALLQPNNFGVTRR